MFNIFNIRDGFANNSSSTHSIILSDKPLDAVVNSYNTDSFGWDNFRLAGQESILDYLRATLCSNLMYSINPEYIKCIVDNWIGNSYDYDSVEYGEFPEVDHQSLIMLPLVFDESAIDRRFFEEVKRTLLQSNIIILGGNDNDDGNPDVGYYDGPQLNFLTDRSSMICKKSDENYWTLFDRRYGTKLRLSFTDKGQEFIQPTKALSPDLVDVKITDFCHFGCNFCYQGSTTNGKHASLSEIRSIIRTLSENEVFEIAFGGGEPTTHPDFIEILKLTRENFIIPNFTTKNLSWIKENLGKIQEFIGSFAFSVSSSHEINKLANIRDFYGIEYHRVCAQYVMGSDSTYAFKAIVKACSEHGIPLTLLGFKEQHRGVNFKKRDYSDWLSVIEELRNNEGLYCKIGIDTKLVEDSQAILKEKFPDWLYHKDEGTFSCYIDAVDKKIGRSSYHELESYKHIYNDFIDKYQAY